MKQQYPMQHIIFEIRTMFDISFDIYYSLYSFLYYIFFHCIFMKNQYASLENIPYIFFVVYGIIAVLLSYLFSKNTFKSDKEKCQHILQLKFFQSLFGNLNKCNQMKNFKWKIRRFVFFTKCEADLGLYIMFYMHTVHLMKYAIHINSMVKNLMNNKN